MCAASGSAPPGRSTKRVRSSACSPKGSRARSEDAIDAGFGVDLMRLSCLAAEPLAPSQAELERAHEAERARALADLIDRLSARLGSRAVTRRELVEAHLPEQAETAVPATLGEARLRGQGDEPIVPQGAPPARPLRLFAHPEPIDALAEVPDGPPLRFRWRRVLHDVAAIEGPERIAAPWWRRPTRRRAIISAPRILKAAASGSTAKACGEKRRSGRNGSCMGCSGSPFAPLAGRRWREAPRTKPFSCLREKVAGRSPAG